MNARSAIYATLVVAVAVGLLLLRGLVPIIPEGKISTFLQANNVRGMEVVWKGQPYTLNFQQQQEMIEYINRSIPVGKIRDSITSYPGLNKIVVYQFGQPTVDLTPVDFNLNEFYFSALTWNPGGYLMDNSAGEMARLVESSHDP